MVARWHRQLSAMPAAAKCTAMFGLIAMVAVGDYLAGNARSFAIFYLLPVAYATWFIGAGAGGVAALLSALCWFGVEVNQEPAASRMLPLGNAVVRLVFFALGVVLVRALKRTELRLMREVLRRTRTLRAEAERRRRLEREILEVTAREQLRVTQDLHDGLGQYLSAFAFHARILADDLRGEQSPRVAQAERLVELVRMMNRTVRRLDRAVRVPEASEGGLPAAMATLTAGFEQLTGIRCAVDLEDPLPAMDHFRVIMHFRIVQEALNNAVKHANPRLIRISIRSEADTLVTRVIDDGRGLSATVNSEPGAGLRIMKLRAELIGGAVALLPNPTGGCIVECRMPLLGATRLES